MSWLYGKILAALAFIGAVFMWKRERKLKNEAIEQSKAQQASIDTLIKESEIKTDIAKRLDVQKAKEQEIRVNNVKLLEEMINEEDNPTIVNNLKRLLVKNRHRD